jgi:CubicO group peptidase (beta-lactamase class C family)
MRKFALTLLLAFITGSVLGRAADPGPVFDIPHLDNITIDGDISDWGDRGFCVNLMANEDGEFRTTEGFDSRFRLGWDERGLLVMVVVKQPSFNETDGALTSGDSLQMFYAPKRGSEDILQLVASPGMSRMHPKLRWNFNDMRVSPDLLKIAPDAQVARFAHGDSYVLEALLPWKNLGITPAKGTELAFQVYANYFGGSELYRALWYPISGASDSSRMYTLRLADQPSPAVDAVATADYELFHRVVVNITCAENVTGQNVTVKDGDKLLATAPLTVKAGLLTSKIVLPMPARGTHYGPLAVALDGRLLKTIELRDPDAARLEAFAREELIFRPSVFSGTAFPDCEWVDPAYVDDLVGSTTFSTTFYDSSYQPVTTADKPGRYGAVVVIKTDDGKTFRRFRALFRMAESVQWDHDGQGGTFTFSPKTGLNPDAAKQQKHEMNTFLPYVVRDSASAPFSTTAAWMAALSEAKPGAPDTNFASDYRALDRQWWVGLKRKLDGDDQRYSKPFVSPRPLAGKPTPVVHEGTLKEAGMKPDAAEKIDALLKQWAADTTEPFAVCIVRHGVIVLHKAYGLRDGKPMTVTTPSWMASITKTMAGTSMMMLVDQGLVSLDDPVDKFLPAFRGVKVATPLTLRHLYTHTAGFHGYWGDQRNDFEEEAGGEYPALEVGKRFEYDGTGPALGSKILERITDEALPQFYKHHLFDPLSMTATTATDSAGDGYSIPLDIAKFGQMLLNRGSYGDKQFFRPETFQQMLPEPLSKVLGPDATGDWGIGTVWFKGEGLGEGTFGHGAASSATLRIDPKDDLVIVMTRNSAGSNFDKYQPKFLQAVADGIAR